MHAAGWSVMAHGFVNVGQRWDPTPRGDRSPFFTQMLMASARRTLGAGWLDANLQLSIESLGGRRGYPLLLQTGETADGVVPLVDRQHPHDALGGASLTYTLEIEEGAWAFLYGALAGSPALGPVPYMHRPSGSINPVAPLSHHFLDATHIAYGVITGGVANDLIQAEASWFNGREPDQERWLPERPALNSWSARLTITPGGSWAAQASFANLDEPEQLHPAVDVYRSTVSLMHHAEWERGAWSTTLAWGQNQRQRTTMTLAEARARLPAPLLAHYLGLAPLPPGADDTLLLLIDKRVRSGTLAETALRWGRITTFARYEGLLKDELFAPPDPRHSTAYRLTKIEAGAAYEAGRRGRLTLRVGGSASAHRLPVELTPLYGARPVGYTLYTRLAF